MSFKSEWEAKKSVYFNGASELTVARPGSGVEQLNPSESEAFSASVWFFDISDYYGTLVGNSTTTSVSTAEGWTIRYYANQMRYWFTDGSGNRLWAYFAYANYSRLQWNNFVMTYDGSGNLKGYYNGVRTLWETQSNTGSLSGVDSSADIKMGNGAAYTDNWTGQMCNVSFWSKELTGLEINEVYKGRDGNIGAGNLNRHSAAGNLVSWWIADDPRDTYNGTIYDMAGAYNATPSGLVDGNLGYGTP